MYKALLISVITCYSHFYCAGQSLPHLKKGTWKAILHLNQEDKLPFKLGISSGRKALVFTIENAEEKIQLTNLKQDGDTIQVDFPNFHSYLKFAVVSKTELSGSWTNLNKGNSYKIPFSAKFEKSSPINNTTNAKISGRWKTTFTPNSNEAEMAIGIFENKTNSNQVTGTFLTETGDYRFLDGFTCGEKMLLSCFDGSHAFLFKAQLRNDSLFGTFNSGKHYKTNWVAEKNAQFELRNPDSITYVVKKEPFQFKMKDLDGKDFVFPNERYENKLTIIQIMGTWCPNCLDESRFLKEMYAKYHDQGLEVISIGYETPASFEEQVEKIKLLQSRLQLNYQFLVGGQANKAIASQQFSMLNEIISFPTAIFIDKKGQVVKVHTGFNGPGTGELYQQFRIEAEAFLKEQLK